MPKRDRRKTPTELRVHAHALLYPLILHSIQTTYKYTGYVSF